MWIIFATVLQWLAGVNLEALHLTLQTFARPAPGIFLLEAWLEMRGAAQQVEELFEVDSHPICPDIFRYVEFAK